MDGLRQFKSASCELLPCTAIPARLRVNTRELIGLKVPEADRRRGYARELMEQVTREADDCGLTLVIMPTAFDEGRRMTDGQLYQWYSRRFGFIAIQSDPIIMARMPYSTPRYIEHRETFKALKDK